MKRIALSSLATGLVLALSLPASAQDDWGTDETATDSAEADAAQPQPAPMPAPVATEPAPAPPPPPPPPRYDGGDDDDGADRGNPADRKLGIGTGYVLPTDLDAVNTVSVRFRFGQLTLEPVVDLSFERSSTDTGAGDSDDNALNLGVGANVRYALADSRGIEFVLLGGGNVNFALADPDGDDNNTNTTTFLLRWGLGLDYWVSSRWVISMAAFNPFLEFQRTSQETAVDDATSSNLGVGLIFNPTVVGMVHLFF